MSFRPLGIFLPEGERVGVLFQYRLANDSITTRFVADDEFIKRKDQPTLSYFFLAESPAEQQALWQDIRSTQMNGRYSERNGWLLPAFFQNLLPEGVFRDRVAELRGCDSNDHFEMLGACGKDLPGAVYALPVELSHGELSKYVTEDNDAVEMSVVAEPLEDGVSLSGVQPKVAVALVDGRYVARTKTKETHIIAKLPVVGQPLLPEVEELSLQLARAAGVNACAASLQPLVKLAVEHGYDLGDADAKTQFLAVERFDRTPNGRIHCEDFAQVLGVMPEDKYGVFDGQNRTSYLAVAAVLMSFDSLGEAAVHELLRRLVVNELLGNPDMHLKNIGLLYPDGMTPTLSPAYDVVAYSAFTRTTGHALQLMPKEIFPAREQPADGAARKQRISPAVVRAFCAALDIVEAPAAAAVRDTVKKAYMLWPDLIEASSITGAQKAKLVGWFKSHPMIESLERRTKE